MDFPDISLTAIPLSLAYGIASAVKKKKIIGTEYLTVTTRDGFKRRLYGKTRSNFNFLCGISL